MATVQDWLRTALPEAQAQLTAEACWQNWYYDQKIGTVNLKPGDLVLVKADAFKGRRKIRDRWEEDTCEVVHQIMTDISSYKVMDQSRRSCILHQNWLLLIASEVGVPLCICVCHAWDRCTSPTLWKPISKGSEDTMMPQENSGWAVTHHSASKTSLGWIYGSLCLLQWTSSRVSFDDGGRLQVMCNGCGFLKDHICLAEGKTSLPIDAIRWWTAWLTQLFREVGHSLQHQNGGV